MPWNLTFFKRALSFRSTLKQQEQLETVQHRQGNSVVGTEESEAKNWHNYIDIFCLIISNEVHGIAVTSNVLNFFKYVLSADDTDAIASHRNQNESVSLL